MIVVVQAHFPNLRSSRALATSHTGTSFERETDEAWQRGERP
jgi:hypothetical protein